MIASLIVGAALVASPLPPLSDVRTIAIVEQYRQAQQVDGPIDSDLVSEFLQWLQAVQIVMKVIAGGDPVVCLDSNGICDCLTQRYDVDDGFDMPPLPLLNDICPQ